jgi:hypothetical protein
MMGPDEFRHIALSMPEAVDQQSMFMDAAPKAFQPVAGGWGQLGSTKVNLASVTHALLQSALGTAWHNIAPKPLLQRVGE